MHEGRSAVSGGKNFIPLTLSPKKTTGRKRSIRLDEKFGDRLGGYHSHCFCVQELRSAIQPVSIFRLLGQNRRTIRPHEGLVGM